jgi:hypothetical protein
MKHLLKFGLLCYPFKVILGRFQTRHTVAEHTVSSDCKYISGKVSVSHEQDTVGQLCLSPSVAETLTCGLATRSALSCMLAFRRDIQSLASLMKWWINILIPPSEWVRATSAWGSDVGATSVRVVASTGCFRDTSRKPPCVSSESGLTLLTFTFYHL